ncbi:hypothetical protein [Mesorhizobium sp.]|uniref:hypothetical protein n=1 Tax=Mesorhizobium sp. TaxID=1871066 RepID=UPI0025CC8AE3|nr:hypothetical protein [Mesorhizobium sp.]
MATVANAHASFKARKASGNGMGVLMKAVGLYRCPGEPPFACVLEGTRGTYITENAYRAGGFKPDFETLPWEGDYRARRENTPTV